MLGAPGIPAEGNPHFLPRGGFPDNPYKIIFRLPFCLDMDILRIYKKIHNPAFEF